MPKILSLDEMLDVMNEIDPTGDNINFGKFRDQMEDLGTRMAAVIAEKLNVDFDPARTEGTAFAGTCANFYPKSEAQAIPAELESFDTGGDWEPRHA